MAMYLLIAYYYNSKELVFTIPKGYTADYKVALDRQNKLQNGFIPTEELTQLSVCIIEIDEL